MITRVRWSNEELDLIIHEARLFELNSRKRMGIRAVVAEAQKILPSHRQRPINKISPSVILRIAKAIEPVEPPPQAPEPVLTPTSPTVLFGLLADQMIDLIAERVVQKLRSQEPAPTPTHDPWTAKENARMRESLGGTHKARRTGVLIIGLLPTQASSISATFAPEMSLSFRTPEEALKQDTLHRDYTILMTKFINHSVQGKYRAAKNLRYCNGGVTELVEILQHIRKESASCTKE